MTKKNQMEEIANSLKEEALSKVAKSVRNKIVERVAKSAQGKLIAHVDILVADIKRLLDNNKADIEDVISLLEKKDKDIAKTLNSREQKYTEAYKQVINALKDMAEKTQSVKVLNQPEAVTKNQFREAMSESLQVIKNILVDVNEVPEAVSVQYNNQNKVSQIIENYGNYKLTTSISYTNDKVSSWNTRRT